MFVTVNGKSDFWVAISMSEEEFESVRESGGSEALALGRKIGNAAQAKRSVLERNGYDPNEIFVNVHASADIFVVVTLNDITARRLVENDRTACHKVIGKIVSQVLRTKEALRAKIDTA